MIAMATTTMTKTAKMTTAVTVIIRLVVFAHNVILNTVGLYGHSYTASSWADTAEIFRDSWADAAEIFRDSWADAADRLCLGIDDFDEPAENVMPMDDIDELSFLSADEVVPISEIVLRSMCGCYKLTIGRHPCDHLCTVFEGATR